MRQVERKNWRLHRLPECRLGFGRKNPVARADDRQTETVDRERSLRGLFQREELPLLLLRRATGQGERFQFGASAGDPLKEAASRPLFAPVFRRAAEDLRRNAECKFFKIRSYD